MAAPLALPGGDLFRGFHTASLECSEAVFRSPRGYLNHPVRKDI